MVAKKTEETLANIADYYSKKLEIFGVSPRGVDWNSKQSQELRFAQLIKLFEYDSEGSFILNDLGCGYGQLFTYLSKFKNKVRYVGIDISQSMIQAAIGYHKDSQNVRFLVGSRPDQIADYSVANGIFNVKLSLNDADWLEHIFETIETLNSYSTKGFAFNCLSTYSDERRRKPELFYADPLKMFDYCARKYTQNLLLIHDYNLFDFTIIVRKEL